MCFLQEQLHASRKQREQSHNEEGKGKKQKKNLNSGQCNLKDLLLNFIARQSLEII